MINDRSRFAKSILYRDGSDEFVGVRKQIDTSERADDRFHQVVEGDRVDLLAYRYLGDSQLWWVLCDYNGIALPLELQAGTVIRIPSVEQVEMRVLG